MSRSCPSPRRPSRTRCARGDPRRAGGAADRAAHTARGAPRSPSGRARSRDSRAPFRDPGCTPSPGVPAQRSARPAASSMTFPSLAGVGPGSAPPARIGLGLPGGAHGLPPRRLLEMPIGDVARRGPVAAQSKPGIHHHMTAREGVGGSRIRALAQPPQACAPPQRARGALEFAGPPVATRSLAP